MDIKYKDKNVEINIKNINKNSILSGEELDSVVRIIELFKGYNNESSVDLSDVVKKTIKSEKKEAVKPVDDDRPIIRDRLPNQIDMSELEIKKAITSHPMIRCPKCGQSSKAIVHIDALDNYFIRKDEKEFNIIADLIEKEIDNMCLPEDASIKDYHDDICKAKVPSLYKDKDLNVNNNTVFECPICREKKSFSVWADAFKNPLEHGFETDILCPVCGKEAVEVFKEGNDSIRQIKCEHCGNTTIDVK